MEATIAEGNKREKPNKKREKVQNAIEAANQPTAHQPILDTAIWQRVSFGGAPIRAIVARSQKRKKNSALVEASMEPMANETCLLSSSANANASANNIVQEGAAVTSERFDFALTSCAAFAPLPQDDGYYLGGECLRELEQGRHRIIWVTPQSNIDPKSLRHGCPKIVRNVPDDGQQTRNIFGCCVFADGEWKATTIHLATTATCGKSQKCKDEKCGGPLHVKFLEARGCWWRFAVSLASNVKCEAAATKDDVQSAAAADIASTRFRTTHLAKVSWRIFTIVDVG